MFTVGKFGKAAERVKDSPYIIPITIVFFIMFVTSIVTSIEDYTTSYRGYMALPTRKANAFVIYFVALIPQIGQIGFSYAWGREALNSKAMALLSLGIALGLHSIDVITDMVYKALGQGPLVWVIAFFESELLYTLGSEVMITVSFGMLVALVPEFIAQIILLKKKYAYIVDQVDLDLDQEDPMANWDL